MHGKVPDLDVAMVVGFCLSPVRGCPLQPDQELEDHQASFTVPREELAGAYADVAVKLFYVVHYLISPLRSC